MSCSLAKFFSNPHYTMLMDYFNHKSQLYISDLDSNKTLRHFEEMREKIVRYRMLGNFPNEDEFISRVFTHNEIIIELWISLFDNLLLIDSKSNALIIRLEIAYPSIFRGNNILLDPICRLKPLIAATISNYSISFLTESRMSEIIPIPTTLFDFNTILLNQSVVELINIRADFNDVSGCDEMKIVSIGDGDAAKDISNILNSIVNSL